MIFNIYIRTKIIIGVILLSACFSGCTNYRLGTTLPSNIRSIYIPTFINQSGEPELENEATQAVIQEFHKDGTLHVTGINTADTILNVILAKYILEPLRYEKNRAKTVEEYRLKIKADIIFKQLSTNKILIKKHVEGESTFVLTEDLTSSKQNALPEATRDLAHDIVESVVEYW